MSFQDKLRERSLEDLKTDLESTRKHVEGFGSRKQQSRGRAKRKKF